MNWFRRIVLAVVTIFVAVTLPSPGAALAHAYDAPAVAPLDVHEFGAVRATQPQLIDQQKESGSPLSSAQGTSTTPYARSVATESGPSFYRGARPGEAPSFEPRPNDFKVDPASGTVKPTYGVSVFDNPGSVTSKGFVPHDVDLSSVPPELRIIQRGADPVQRLVRVSDRAGFV